MRYLTWMVVAMSCLSAGCGGGRGNTTPTPAAQVNPTVTPTSFLTFINTSLPIDSDAYANAYYKAVDPTGVRTTLAAWKSVNGFDQGVDNHVTFRDAKDLGYGRDMYARHRADGGIAIYVDNYVVQVEPGDATTYGPLNLDAAINREQKYHIGTNAIEFSADPSDASHRIAKFFTFGPEDANGVQHRLTAADLDGRGIKHMPTECVVCHGGTMYPVQLDGTFEPLSLKSPKLHIIEENSVQFSALAGFTEAAQRDGIKAINAMVLQASQEMGMRADATTDQANWDSAFVKELLEGAYGGVGFPTAYQADFVPAGWKQTPTRPVGVETLYKQVIEPHCIGCHSLRGTKIAKNSLPPPAYPNATNFSSYEEFSAYNDLIIDYVYRRGAMPRSLVNFSQFWEHPDGAPTLLATYLTGFNVFDKNGKVVMPGRAVAIPGTDRTVRSPATLTASASMFTDSYAWRIVATPSGATASLSSATSAAPVLTGDKDGAYVIELVTSNVMGPSAPVQVTITIDSTLTPSQTDLTFVKDIMSSNGIAGVFGSSGAGCGACHTSSGGYTGIPVYYAVGDYVGKEKDLYRKVLNRVNLADPENSLLLRKPTSLQHGGGIVLDRSSAASNALYNKLLNWIRNGAPCGIDATYCN
ncbi:MAG: hypothetical protein ACYDC8_09705 [Gammaproteobacteria bacterium]